MARKVDGKTLSEIVNYRRTGTKISTIAKLVGISKDSIYHYKRTGEEIFLALEKDEVEESELSEMDLLYLGFFVKLMKAEGQYEHELHLKIYRNKSWMSASYLLERQGEGYLKPRERSESDIEAEEESGLAVLDKFNFSEDMTPLERMKAINEANGIPDTRTVRIAGEDEDE